MARFITVTSTRRGTFSRRDVAVLQKESSPFPLKRQPEKAEDEEDVKLHPQQFEVNEAWIAFRLNGTPVRTERDGDFNCIALMDAASCFLLGSQFIPVTAPEPTRAQFRSLFHDLRHTWASWHVQNGTPLFALQELGGWETERMVRRYAHLSADHLAQWAGHAQIHGTFLAHPISTRHIPDTLFGWASGTLCPSHPMLRSTPQYATEGSMKV